MSNRPQWQHHRIGWPGAAPTLSCCLLSNIAHLRGVAPQDPIQWACCRSGLLPWAWATTHPRTRPNWAPTRLVSRHMATGRPLGQRVNWAPTHIWPRGSTPGGREGPEAGEAPHHEFSPHLRPCPCYVTHMKARPCSPGPLPAQGSQGCRTTRSMSSTTCTHRWFGPRAGMSSGAEGATPLTTWLPVLPTDF